MPKMKIVFVVFSDLGVPRGRVGPCIIFSIVIFFNSLPSGIFLSTLSFHLVDTAQGFTNLGGGSFSKNAAP